jgi:hypothetical protein
MSCITILRPSNCGAKHIADITKNITTATNTGTAFGNIRFKNSIITQILVPNHTKIQKNIHISELSAKICLSLLKYKTIWTTLWLH